MARAVHLALARRRRTPDAVPAQCRPKGSSNTRRGEILAGDRFWRAHNGQWIDLATGAPVSLAGLPRVEAPRERRWVDRCTALAGLWHPHLLRLVDFGWTGSRRFEAWLVCRPWRRGRDRVVACALRSAVAFLHACGLSAGAPGWRRLGESGHCPVLVPDALTGTAFEAGGVETAERERASWTSWLEGWRDPPGARIVGVRLQPRHAERWVLDVLDEAAPGGTRLLRLRAAPGAGAETLLASIAREARRRGFVPLDAAVALAQPDVVKALGERHVVLMCRSPLRVSSPLLTLGLRSARGHVVLSVDRDFAAAETSGLEPPGVVALDPLPVESMVRMVTFYPPEVIDARQVRRAAEEAAGWPGRFVARLLATEAPSRARRLRVWTVHESRETYTAGSGTGGVSPVGQGPGRVEVAPRPDGGLERPAPGLTRLGARVAAGVALAARGRHSAAVRTLQASVRAIERRGAREVAVGAVLPLASLLASRGRAIEALRWLDQVADVGDLDARLRVAVAIAELRIDEARLTEGEAAARAARLASQQGGAAEREAEAALALARSLYWQRRYAEAAEALPQPDGPAAVGVRRHAWQARIAAARGDVILACRAASRALEACRGVDDAAAEACAHRAKAEVAALAGDEVVFREHVTSACAAARRARHPLSVVRAELVRSAGAMRLGLADERRRAQRVLARWRMRRLPALLRQRMEAALERDHARAVVPISAVGLGPPDHPMPCADELREISELLRICHETPDELAALAQVCAALRERLHALAVEVTAEASDGICRLAGAGAPAAGFALATRLRGSGLVIGPALGPGGLEAGASGWYGGASIGAITVRWAVDRHIDAARASRMLAAASAASAPLVRAALDRRAAPKPEGPAVPALVGVSSAIAAVREAAARAARVPFGVLVEGESGSGKELVARVIHHLSPRRDRRFSALNCAALTDELVEAELFGYARGAFTGAVTERAGLFEEAHQGTLLLDEVAELSPRAQAKLLRAVQDGEVRRVGENLPRRVDVRLIAASNRPLEDEVRAGRFRADLRYRLDVIRIVVPPLRDRPEDIALLAVHFWERAIARTGSRATLAPEALAVLARYEWPGNVRELQNVMAALAAAAGPRGRVGPRDLPAALLHAADPAGPLTLQQARIAFERRFVRAALARAAGHRGRAARTLGVSRQGLAKLMKRLDLDEPAGGTSRRRAG